MRVRGSDGLLHLVPAELSQTYPLPVRSEVWAEDADRFRDEITAAHVPKHPGTQRGVPPRETLARVLPLAPALGITRIANITGLDCVGIPVVIACRPNSRGLAVRPGKGLDLEAAKASALMEAVERHQAERLELPLRVGSVEDLQERTRLVDVTRLARAPGPAFDPSRGGLWAPGLELMERHEQPTWVPYEVVHTDWTVPGGPEVGGLEKSSNGLASGNHVIEAISHALCEVIERDAVSVVKFSGDAARDARRVDLATVDDPGCLDVLARFEGAGVEVGVWDVTVDTGIATFLCLIADRDAADPRDLAGSVGSGTHPNRAVALARALTEAAQSRLTFIAGARDDAPRAKYRRWHSPAMAERTRALLATPPQRGFEAAPTYRSTSVEDDLRHLLDHVADAGFDSVVVLDLRRRDVPVPVVRVVVPGLESEVSEDHALPGPRAIRAALRAGR